MTAYYNEHDRDAAAHLRALIAAGHIAPGIVDERSIEDVTPADLAPFAQCHFFAGLGIWSLALRAAGIADDYPIWTGSCPCQPFSSAGAGGGFEDKRHLWPVWERLIAQSRPAKIIGEQVASKNAEPWLDALQVDLEALDYAVASVAFPSASCGAPHIRDRLYCVALGDTCREGLERHAGNDSTARRPGQIGPIAAPSVFNRLADPRGTDHRGEVESAHNGQSQINRPTNQSGGCSDTPGSVGHSTGERGGTSGAHISGDEPHWPNGASGMAVAGSERHDGRGIDGPTGEPVSGRSATPGHSAPTHGLADHELQQRPNGQPGISATDTAGGRIQGSTEIAGLCGDSGPGPVNGFWRAADWVFCRDGKWRPVEPGTQPLAHGMPRSMGALSPELQRLAEVAGLSNASLKRAKSYRTSALRGYGNAINAEAARLFIECCLK